MSNLSEGIKVKLAAMTDDYIKQLPARFDEVSREARKARIKESLELLTILKGSLHKLAGSGATFGLEELSRKSKELEDFLNCFINENPDFSSFNWPDFDRYLSEIERICKPKENIGELEELEELPEMLISGIKNNNIDLDSNRHDRNVLIYLANEEDLVLAEIADQMEIFGFQIKALYNLPDVEKFLKEDNCRLIIVNTEFIESDPSFGQKLLQIKKIYSNFLSYIFVANRDDFDLRLKTVKSGGDAFFVMPIDTGILVDKIDKLTSRTNHPPYHVLLIDDDPEQIAYYALVLQQAGMITSVASDPKRVIEVLVESKPEIIILDMYMPVCDGIELASIIRQHESFLTIPIIFLSAEQSEEKQLEAMRSGADDFLTKPIRPDNLIIRINAKAARNRNLRFLMERDSLTGLLNHANLKERISVEMMRVKRSGGNLCYAMIDVDHFKNVNDTYGHLAGDHVLKSLSRMLQDRLRRTDVIGRYGGEEFGVILINTDSENAFRVMEEVRKNFALVKHKSDEDEFYITFSCGIASFVECETSSELNDAADKAMYEAKTSGRNRTIIHKK
ncbi:MAG: diguanylate cyclase [Spirochaetia bacterium]|nr:diguanylate cyclase [Spirochaetia bacterium]